MKHIFKKMLRIEVAYTTKIENFIAHNGPKITYTKQPLQNEFFVGCHNLLFQQGIEDLDIKVLDWEGAPCFFPSTDRSSLPFDIFAASFYLLSRYEEYEPHVKDEHGRYPYKESIGYKNNFLELPVVDIWIGRLKAILKQKFPQLEFKENTFKQTSLIDVPVTSQYSNRGVVRTLGGYLLDIAKFKLKDIWRRTLVLLLIKKDPYDNFEWLVNFHQQEKAKAIFFFLLADYSTHDKNITVNSNKLRNLIKWVADYNIVSLMISYKSLHNVEGLKNERNRLINMIHRPIKRVRLRYNRLILPEVYRNLIEAEFNEDYSMGYTRALGFRAGTCTPFFFYDIAQEVELPLLVNPFCVHSTVLTRIGDKDRILEAVLKIKQEVMKVSGSFNMVFLNTLFSDEHALNWKNIYQNIITTENA